MTHNRKKNQSLKINQELTQTLELAEEIKKIILTAFHMLIKLRHVRYKKNTQIEILERKNG